jgi:hypothetical protein
LRSAQLQDDRYLAEVELEIERQRREGAANARPPLEHFSPEVEAIYCLSDDIRMLINAQRPPGSDPVPPRDRPESPADRIAARKREIARNLNAEAIGGE